MGSIYKDQYWKLFCLGRGEGKSAGEGGVKAEDGGWKLVGTQAISAVSAGCTTSFVTTPLDVIKTRYQVASRAMAASEGGSRGARPTAYGEVTALFRKEGGSRGARPTAYGE